MREILKKGSVQELILLLAGTGSILSVIQAVPGVSYSPAAMFLAAVLVCGSLFIMYRQNRRWLLYEIIVLHIAFAVIVFLQRGRISDQFAVLYGNLADTSVQTETNMTPLVLLAALMFTVWFFLFEIVWKLHWIPYIMLSAILFGAPMLGVRIRIVSVAFGIFFQILFWHIHTAEKRPESGDGRKSREKNNAVRENIGLGALLACLLGVSVLVVSVFGTDISNAAFYMEGVVSRSLQNLSGQAHHPAASGYVSGGNNYRTGETQMEVILMERPEDTIYLKGFTGGEYSEGEWAATDEQEIFHEMASVLGWQQWESWISGLYYNLYFSMNAESSVNRDHVHTVYLDYEAQSYDTVFAPYYSEWVSQGDPSGNRICFRYYEAEDMAIDWDNVSEEFTTLRDWYQQVQGAYQQVMQDIYTRLPEEFIPELTELFGGSTPVSLEEATGNIIAALQSSMTYTLTPGRTPVNRDVVEYALFDSHKGYCVHYASAASLMYRFFHIPARYVSGYAVAPSEFTLQEDGTWKAEVTDFSAHAWTEIFLEDYGWTPVEVTPTADGSFTTSYPGLEAETLRNIVSSIDLSAEDTGESAVTESDGANTEQTGEQSERETISFDLGRYHDQILILITAAAEFILFLPLLLRYRRLYRRSRLGELECREVFVRLLGMLRSEGYMNGYTGNEPDFAKALSSKIPCVEHAEAEKLQEIIQKTAYGNKAASEEENEFVRKIYIKVSKYIESRMRGVQKIRFRYLSRNL